MNIEWFFFSLHCSLVWLKKVKLFWTWWLKKYIILSEPRHYYTNVIFSTQQINRFFFSLYDKKTEKRKGIYHTACLRRVKFSHFVICIMFMTINIGYYKAQTLHGPMRRILTLLFKQEVDWTLPIVPRVCNR